MLYYVLFNPLSANRRSNIHLHEFKEKYKDDEIIVIDVIDHKLTIDFLEGIDANAKVVIIGGDGTLNHFINDIKGYKPKNNIYLYSGGTGNDFIRDVKDRLEDDLILLNDLISDLPTVTIDDEQSLFINGIGFGIDGYVCTEGIKLAEKCKGEVNYTAISIKLLLFKYKPRNATITVDGKTFNFKKVWLASSMKGRYYGSGMMVAPSQNREDGLVSMVCLHGSRKLKALKIFPSIFKGKHTNYKKNVTIIRGREITIEFDKPSDLQIDGEVRYNVKKYSVKA